jgi:MFS superfamily sulfate permease-like transporter
VIALVAFIRDMATAIPVALTSAVLVMLACHLLARLLAGRVRAAASLNNLRTP